MSLEVLPNALFSNHHCKLLISNQNASAAIFYKKLAEDLLDKEIFLNTHALVYIIKGSIACRNHDGSYITAREGELALLNKDLYSVSDYVPESACFEAIVFFFDQNSLDDYFSKSPFDLKTNANATATFSLRSDERLQSYMASLQSVYTDALQNDAITNTKLVELLQLIELAANAAPITQALLRPSSTHKRDIQQFMKMHFLKDLRISEFADLCGRSESQFKQEFKAIFSSPPAKWLIQQRLRHARSLLSKGKSVSETAAICAYQNLSHFIQAYKQQFGATPKQAQKILLKNQH